ncbi:interleukin-12 receptor subunit beta-1 [Nothoprocta perdicaria]|uniref:interleukin-12 receptor subunit beta-1 n=1 Tax=Nothoprocta perdicaria TaxID=30464 RepID=UPI000E1BE93F|nr:interleukin-12 receptor subunit beta-1 [Nothoprocta perdicaria]
MSPDSTTSPSPHCATSSRSATSLSPRSVTSPGSATSWRSRAGAAAESGLSCYRLCGTSSFVCRWPPWGPPGNTSYELVLCYVRPRRCQRYPAGGRAALALPLRSVYVLTNATAWVEARGAARPRHGANLTLYLHEAVKLQPPALGSSWGKAGGRLRLRLPRPRCHEGPRPLQREARYRRPGEHTWTRVPCESERVENSEEEAVSCTLRARAALELQLRHKPPHWSSYWSEWSESLAMPEELVESPVARYELGRLGADGQRVLRLAWQPPRTEQGPVTYTLRARMLPCRCAQPPAQERLLLLDAAAAGHNVTLSGAAYDVALTATNAAGPGPAWHLHVPPEPAAGSARCRGHWGGMRMRSRPPCAGAELGGEGVRAAGGAVTVPWEAAHAGLAYCFEKQPLAAAPRQDECVRRQFPARSLHVETGLLAEQGCYRLAVHGWAQERGWATFVLTHRYVGNASLAASLRVDAGADSAVLHWEPSPRAACPGALHGYLICYGHEGHNLSQLEAAASARRYVLRGLRPGTVYRVGVREVPAEPGAACAARWRFLTKAQGSGRGPRRAPDLRYLGVLAALPALAALCRLGKERAARRLWPPLPRPRGTEALHFPPADAAQGWCRGGFVQPSEHCSRAELLLPQPAAEPGSPGGSRRQEEPEPGKPGLQRRLLHVEEAAAPQSGGDVAAAPGTL